MAAGWPRPCYLGGISGLAVLGAWLGEQREPASVLREHHAASWIFGAALGVATLCAFGPATPLVGARELTARCRGALRPA